MAELIVIIEHHAKTRLATGQMGDIFLASLLVDGELIKGYGSSRSYALNMLATKVRSIKNLDIYIP